MPDSMSREGSPAPQVLSELDLRGQMVVSQTPIVPTLADLRFSQSAPGSPGTVWPGCCSLLLLFIAIIPASCCLQLIVYSSLVGSCLHKVVMVLVVEPWL